MPPSSSSPNQSGQATRTAGGGATVQWRGMACRNCAQVDRARAKSLASALGQCMSPGEERRELCGSEARSRRLLPRRRLRAGVATDRNVCPRRPLDSRRRPPRPFQRNHGVGDESHVKAKQQYMLDATSCTRLRASTASAYDAKSPSCWPSRDIYDVTDCSMKKKRTKASLLRGISFY